MAIQQNLIVKQASIAGLAASTNSGAITVDLGANFAGGVAWLTKRGTASATEMMFIQFSDDNVTFYNATNFALTGQSYSSTSGAGMDCGARVQGRYMRGFFANGTVVQAAGAILRLQIQPDSA